eukprot:gene23180-27560_t
MEVREKLDPVELQKAVTAMSQAQRVEFYGFGASGAVAADDLLITANLVRESGATLITLCPSQTPLAELSTVNLAIDVHEDTEIYTPLTSRIAHLVVIDVLAMGVAMARGPSLVNHLKSVKRSLRSLRLSPKS